MKKLFLLVVCLAALAGTGCSKIAEDVKAEIARAVAELEKDDTEDSAPGNYYAEDSAVQTKADSSYTNSYLGFSFTVPKGWWIYSVNGNNFASDPALTESPNSLDISYGEDNGENYSFIQLANFANLKDSRRDNHLGFDISAESLEGVTTLDRYMEYFEAYMLTPDGNTYKLLDAGTAMINGSQYERRVFEVIQEKDNYIFLTFTRPAGDNNFLTIKTSYWPDNRNAEILITGALSKAMP